MSKNNYGDRNSSNNTLITAYGLANKIKEDMNEIGLEEAYTAVNVNMDFESGKTNINYVLEATDVYEELDYTPETMHFENASIIEPVDDAFPVDEDIVTETLEENLESALMVNGKVVKELLSPEYDAF